MTDAYDASFDEHEISNNQDTNYDPVVSKYCKAVPADIIHQETDGQKGYHKGGDAADHKDHDLITR